MSYWSEQGCVLAQPYNTEVGAGTLNPATFLRVLGPEPWRTAYVEPSVRPDDSRYGENPNRMQTHTQFQVILKPDPGNSQELYLGSLQALGIDTRRHDVRFVEDNWESPALGAWGLGWEVWLDGLEITQFTYFQQAGGITLNPVSVEITYGLERILMALQGAQHFKDIVYTAGVLYGEIQAEAELEMSTYYLDQADVATQKTLFETYEAQARRLVELGLPLPAHNYVLKCSHAFNVLDSRGAVGTNERASAFVRMRGLAHEVAKLWLRRREELQHPLGVWAAPDAPALAEVKEYPDGAADLLFEIGLEELPAAAVTLGIAQLSQQLARRLESAELAHGGLRVWGTPRRLVAAVADLAPRQPDRVVEMRGPRADVAFDSNGAPTPAGQGFARKAGMAAEDLPVVEVDGTPYVVVSRTEPGQRTGDLLRSLLPEVAGSLNFERNMRWGAGAASYARPVRWVSALLGDVVVPFDFAGVASGRSTRVGRDDVPSEVTVESASSYGTLMAAHEIVVDPDARKESIVAAARRLAADAGGVVDLQVDAKVVDEVANLVERPVVLLGHFDPTYLALPAVVLTTVMKKHQRYLPVRTGDGDVLAAFVVVANGPIDDDSVRTGNEAVLRARFADASFFFERDVQRPLEDFRSGLEQLVFEERAGSMLDRSARVERLAGWLSERLGLSSAERDSLLRAAHLAKADLTTEMVVEMSSLAGEIGRIYALRSGEAPEVAQAIYEHVLPRFAGDGLPASKVGAVLAIADRVDALVALFAVGAQPTGSSDPYGLRRAALGLVQTCQQHDVRVPLSELFEVSAGMQDVSVPTVALADLHTFVVARLERRLLDAGHRADLVRAVTNALVSPAASVEALAELEALVDSDDFRAVGAGYRRTSRIARGTSPGPVDPELFDAEEERALWKAWQTVATDVEGATTLTDFTRSFGQLVNPIDEFFAAVMVNSDDPAQRQNRLRMLATVAAPGAQLLDWETIADL